MHLCELGSLLAEAYGGPSYHNLPNWPVIVTLRSAVCCTALVHAWPQGLVRAEGAVLRQLSGGAAGSPWRVLLKEGEQFVQVGRSS
jgi:hypothetical protein